MLEVAELSVTYGAHPVLHEVSLRVEEGQLAVVLGSNGAGKTTLINTVAGIVPALSGAIRLRGEELLSLPAHERAARGIATVPQGRGLFPDMTVAENLDLGAFANARRKEVRRQRDRVFALFPRLAERRRQAAETMSGGEQQMLAIGRALMSEPTLLLLDEPSLGLSPALTGEVFRIIRAILDEGVSILLVEQNARQSLKIGDYAYLLDGGRIVGAGAARAIQSDHKVVDAYLGGRGAVPAPLVTRDGRRLTPRPRFEDFKREGRTMYLTPFIGGTALDMETSVNVLNPLDQSVYATISYGGEAEMRAAIDAAEAAFPAWSKTPPAAREAVLYKAAELLEERREEVVDVLISEAGSTFIKSQFEVSFTANMLRSAAGEARRIFGEVIPSDIPGMTSLAVRKPLGVVAGISPFNFPLILGTKKLCMAIAAGNTFVHKPSEETSLLALTVAAIFNDAGLPEGVLNVVPGKGPELGQAILEDPRVKLVSFTGSTKVGQALAAECAKHGKRVTLEMGGKSPLVVLKDAELDYAVDTAAFGIFIHQGQICMAGSRIIVDQNLYDEFLERFAAKTRGIKVGDPRDPETVIGPLIRMSQCGFIKEHIDQAVAKGAEVLVGGDYEGAIFKPTILAHVTPYMSAYHTELFGPVVTVTRAENADHALQLANDSSYGLSAAVLTNDLQEALRFADELDTGMVHINGPTIHDEPHVPFGGVKDSGLGREGGRWSMEEMTEVKWITLQRGHRHYPF
jgi:acyl-CoA reductase-like NAD-dependent aldehyde dehydrogenase/ABC-type branched-subunit amino acid transport system ATPase component